MKSDEILGEVWPVFRAEAREIVQSISRRVLALEAGESSPEMHEAVERDAHSLKGMSGSLAIEDFVALAHAFEDLLVASRGVPRLPRAAAESILQALDAMEAAIEAAQEPGAVRVEGLPEWLARLSASAIPGGAAAGPATVPPRTSEAAVEVPTAPATSEDRRPEPVASRPPSPPAAASEDPGREEGAIRVPAKTIDRIGGYVEALSLVANAAERRARALVGAGEELQSAALAARAASLQDPEALSAALDRLTELAREVARQGTDSQRDALRHRLETTAAREDLRQLRMVPISLALEPLWRAVRNAASAVGKQVELRLEGEELRLDRRIVEAVKDPLVHLVRNAVDHGIELAEARRAAGKEPAGRIEIRVVSRGHRVSIEVADDGAGLQVDRIRHRAVERKLLDPEEAARLPDAEVYHLAFRPGFSTVDRVTAISGRGVGLDVVQSAVTRLQGSIQVSSTPGRGTTFELDLPLALSVTLGVLVRIDASRAALPAEAVERVLRLKPDQVRQVLDRRVATVGATQLPFEDLADLLQVGDRSPSPDGMARPALLLRLGGARMVLGVDEVLGEKEFVVRGLGRRGAAATLLSGAALLDDGAIVSVLNPAMLMGRSRSMPETRAARARIVVADDSLTSRTTLKTVLEVAGFAVVPAADGEEAWSHVERGGVDLVVTDRQMPRLDGLALTRRIKSDPGRRALPVILVTSLGAPEDRRAGLEAGADGYLVKQEVQSGSLLDLIRALLPERHG